MPRIHDATRQPNLRAVAAMLLGSTLALTAVDASAAVDYAQLHAFGGDEGSCPDGALIMASDGFFYGLTGRGGKHGLGTLYRVNRQGKVKVMHQFGLGTGNGKRPGGPLIEIDGALYGVAQGGGADNDGIVFRIALDGQFTVLHSFAGSVDGKWPQGPLMLASDGSLYGETYFGGTYDEGTIYRMDLQGNITTLWHMNPYGAGDIGSPGGGLIQAQDGRLVGTGAKGGTLGEGGIFAINADGSHETLYSFDGNDGWLAVNGVWQATDGTFYGTTPSDTWDAAGVAFKLQLDGKYTVLHYFTGEQQTLWRPNGPISTWGAHDNVLVGTTIAGGAHAQGGVWKLNVDGTYQVLYEFGEAIAGGQDGSEPEAGLVRVGNRYYGTTCTGGANNLGTLYRVSW